MSTQKATLSIDDIVRGIRLASADYPLKRVSLFGSYANGDYDRDSDVDLLVEFATPYVSMFVLAGLKVMLEDMWHKNVDVIHAPLSSDAMINIDNEVPIYES